MDGCPDVPEDARPLSNSPVSELAREAEVPSAAAAMASGAADVGAGGAVAGPGGGVTAAAGGRGLEGNGGKRGAGASSVRREGRGLRLVDLVDMERIALKERSRLDAEHAVELIGRAFAGLQRRTMAPGDLVWKEHMRGGGADREKGGIGGKRVVGVVVLPGDTVRTIAQRHGCSPHDVRAMNGMGRDSNWLAAGQELMVPCAPRAAALRKRTQLRATATVPGEAASTSSSGPSSGQGGRSILTLQATAGPAWGGRGGAAGAQADIRPRTGAGQIGLKLRRATAAAKKRVLGWVRRGDGGAAAMSASGEVAPGPPTIVYRIQEGDTLDTISARFRISVAEIKFQNGIYREDKLCIDDEIRIILPAKNMLAAGDAESGRRRVDGYSMAPGDALLDVPSDGVVPASHEEAECDEFASTEGAESDGGVESAESRQSQKEGMDEMALSAISLAPPKERLASVLAGAKKRLVGAFKNDQGKSARAVRKAEAGRLREAERLAIRSYETMILGSDPLLIAGDDTGRLRTYTVRPLDTLESVSRHYGVSVADLREINKLDGDVLRIGAVLKLDMPSMAELDEGELRRIPRRTFRRPMLAEWAAQATRRFNQIRQEDAVGGADNLARKAKPKLVSSKQELDMEAKGIKNDKLQRQLKALARAGGKGRKESLLIPPGGLNFMNPVNPLEGYVSSTYGWRWGYMHKGIDVAANLGTPVLASEAGEVIHADWYGGYGLTVKVRHEGGFETWYAHNHDLLVWPGDVIRKGDEIATIGMTGHATGPHLHFEIRREGKPIDPGYFINLPVDES